MNNKTSVKLHSEILGPADQSAKGIGKNDRNMTSISNFNKEDGFKVNGNNSSKKVDFSMDKNDEDHIDTSSLKKI